MNMAQFGRDGTARRHHSGKADTMSWVILVDQPKRFSQRRHAAQGHHRPATISRTRRCSRPAAEDHQPVALLRLPVPGYYASLLAEARGHRVIPTVETMLDLREPKLYEHALPELEEALNHCAQGADCQPRRDVQAPVLLRHRPRSALRGASAGCCSTGSAARRSRSTIDAGERWAIDRLHPPAPLAKLATGGDGILPRGLHQHTQREWRDPRRARRRAIPSPCCTIRRRSCRRRSPRRSSIWPAIAEKHVGRGRADHQAGSSPSSPNSTRCSSARPPRSTITPTASPGARSRKACRSSTIRISMIRCTNKVYLHELLAAQQRAGAADGDARRRRRPADGRRRLGLPLVVKIPDGSFSRGVHKVETQRGVSQALADELFEDTDLLLAQKFMPTELRLARRRARAASRSLSASIMMAKRHWQIVKHGPNGGAEGGRLQDASPLGEAPPQVIDTAVQAARAIGDGLYGVDIKETPDGVVRHRGQRQSRISSTASRTRSARTRSGTQVLKWFIKRIDA